MKHVAAPLLALVVPACLIGAYHFAPEFASLITPLTASPWAFWSSVLIYVLFVGWAVFAYVYGLWQMGRERQLIAFLRRHVEQHAEQHWHYVVDEESVVASGIFGSKRDEANARERTITGRIVSLLHADARFFRFEPVHVLMRTEAQALSACSTHVAAFQSLAVRAGILGTFIGLIISLGEVQEVFLLRGTEMANASMVDVNAELTVLRQQIAELMGQVVQGLAMAFGTSIFGLVAAFVIYFMALAVRGEERKLTREIHGICQLVQKLFRDHTHQNTELVQTAEALRSVMKENLSALSGASKSLHENAALIVQTSGVLGSGLQEPVRLFASNAANLTQLLEQSAAATMAAKEVSASLSAAEQGAAKRIEAVANQLASLSEHSSRQMSLAIEANGKAIAETGQAVAGSVQTALHVLSDELLSGLGPKLGGELQREALTGLLDELGKMHVAHALSIQEIRGEGRRQLRQTVLLFAVIFIGFAAGAATFNREGFIAFLPATKSSVTQVPSGEPEGKPDVH